MPKYNAGDELIPAVLRTFPHTLLKKQAESCLGPYSDIVRAVLGEKLGPVRIRRLAFLFARALGWGSAPMFTEALAGFLDRALGENTLRHMALRLLANREELLATGTIRKWYGDPPDWIVVEALSSIMYHDKRLDANLVSVKMLACSGHAAGSVYEFRLSPKYVCWLSREIGACPRWGECSPRDLTGMRLTCLFGLRPNGKFYPLKALAHTGQIGWNTEIRRERSAHMHNKAGMSDDELRTQKCPRTVSCTQCERGLDICRYAVKEYTITTEGDPQDGNSDQKDGGEILCPEQGRDQLVPLGRGLGDQCDIRADAGEGVGDAQSAGNTDDGSGEMPGRDDQ